MLYSETDDRLVFAVEKCMVQGPIDGIVNIVYESINASQATRLADKEKVKVDRLIQEISEVPSTQNDVSYGKNQYAEGDLVHDDTYFLEMVAFEFQDTEFLVPKHRLLQKTDYLSSIFEVNSETPEIPIRLPGVSAHDFRGLMRYLYPSESNRELTTSDWISTLKLATKWKMLSTREEAIQKLDAGDNLTGIMKVQLGNECKISEWARAGYVSLIERQEHFTVAEVDAIGLHRASKLCELREKRYAEEWDTYLNRLTLEVHGTSNLISKHIPQFEEPHDHGHDLVQTILDAQNSGNRTLVLDAWGKMAKRTESLTSEEAERLTLPTAVKLWEVRLETRRAAWSLVQDVGVRYTATLSDALRQVSDAFEEELMNVEIDESAYAPFKQEKGKKPVTTPKSDSESNGYKPAASPFAPPKAAKSKKPSSPWGVKTSPIPAPPNGSTSYSRAESTSSGWGSSLSDWGAASWRAAGEKSDQANKPKLEETKSEILDVGDVFATGEPETAREEEPAASSSTVPGSPPKKTMAFDFETPAYVKVEEKEDELSPSSGPSSPAPAFKTGTKSYSLAKRTSTGWGSRLSGWDTSQWGVASEKAKQVAEPQPEEAKAEYNPFDMAATPAAVPEPTEPEPAPSSSIWNKKPAKVRK